MVWSEPMDEGRYLQVAEALRREISELGPNSRLPTERELQQRFGVSRATVRRALGMLERSGLVSRERRRGTSVSPPKIVRSLSPLYSIEEDLKRQGAKWETKLLGFHRAVPAPEFVQRGLHLAPDVRPGLLAVLRLVENRTIAYDCRYFPPVIAGRFDPMLLGDRPITEVVGEIAGAPVTGSDTDTEIIAAAPDVAAALGITPGMLILNNTGVHYLDDGTPVQLASVSYRVDRVRFRSSMRYRRPQA
jgi:GntR family transcriptional regulator